MGNSLKRVAESKQNLVAKYNQIMDQGAFCSTGKFKIFEKDVPWREAASIILVAKSPEPPPVDPRDMMNPKFEAFPNYKVLLLKRPSTSKFMPDTFVFPGGAFSPATDWSDQWMPGYCKYLGFPSLNSDPAPMRKHIEGIYAWPLPRPPLFQKYRQLAREASQKAQLEEQAAEEHRLKLPAEFAFKICALRELFEETGLLLARDMRMQTDVVFTSSDRSNLGQRVLAPNRNEIALSEGSELQKATCEDASRFIQHFLDNDTVLFPNVNLLKEWSNWLTPASFANRHRFDAMFYIACLDSEPAVNICGEEIAEARWMCPLDTLRKACKGEIILAPPQIYELSRLVNFLDIAHLKLFATERERQGCERFCPVMIKCRNNKIASVLQGDPWYPMDEHFIYKEKQPIAEMLLNYAERRGPTHRMIMESDSGRANWHSFMIQTHALPIGGHLKPKECVDEELYRKQLRTGLF